MSVTVIQQAAASQQVRELVQALRTVVMSLDMIQELNLNLEADEMIPVFGIDPAEIPLATWLNFTNQLDGHMDDDLVKNFIGHLV